MPYLYDLSDGEFPQEIPVIHYFKLRNFRVMQYKKEKN